MRSTTPLQPETDDQLDNGTKLRRFCFTINNWTPSEYDALVSFPCKWLIVAKERGGKNGTPHLQGACILNTQKTFLSLKKMPHFSRAHIQKMRGTPEQNITYCTKEDKNAFTKGALPNPGKRNDIHEAIAKVRSATSMQDLVISDVDFAATFIKYSKGLITYRNYYDQHRTEKPTVFWLHGESGTGKTESAVEWANRHGLSYWMSHGSLQWFDGYDGEPLTILDDFRSGHCKFSFLLRLLDKYRFSVPFKGGFRNWTPRYIIITAPLPPREMFDLKKEGDILQLERRIDFLLQSPITVDQLDTCSNPSGNREESQVAAQSSSLLGEDANSDRITTTTSEQQTPELSSEDSIDIRVAQQIKKKLKRTKSCIDLTQEPQQKKLKIDLTQPYDSFSEESFESAYKKQPYSTIIDDMFTESQQEKQLAEDAQLEEVWRQTTNQMNKLIDLTKSSNKVNELIDLT